MALPAAFVKIMRAWPLSTIMPRRAAQGLA
jgi:hypothetical protein